MRADASVWWLLRATLSFRQATLDLKLSTKDTCKKVLLEQMEHVVP